MRIHSDSLSYGDLEGAARRAGVTIVNFHLRGSRSRDHALDVTLSGTGKHGGQWGNTEYRSATFDEWGLFIQALYRKDPDALIGPYRSAEHFTWIFEGRYAELIQMTELSREQFMCRKHRWENFVKPIPGTRARADECAKCGAVMHTLPVGTTWEQWSGLNVTV